MRGLALAAVCAGCLASLDGRPCPCVDDGWRCCEATQLCQRESELCEGSDLAAPSFLKLSAVAGTSFGIVDVRQNAALSFTLTNSGVQPTAAADLTTGDAQFSLGSSDCDRALAPGDSCGFQIVFSPSAFGAKSTTLTAASSPAGQAGLQLDGTGRDQVALRVSLGADSSNNGSVTASGSVSGGGISCPGSCTLQLERTTGDPMVALTASPAPITSQAPAWSGCTSSSGNGCLVSVSGSPSSPTVVNAQFALHDVPWSFLVSGVNGAAGVIGYDGGSCPSGSTCMPIFHYGDSVTLTATGGAGSNAVLPAGDHLPWSFAGWSGGPCSGTTASSCVVPSVTSPMSVSATFTPYNYMFVTSEADFTGDLGQFDPSGLHDGLAGADARCQGLAATSTLAAVRAGKYRALLALGLPDPWDPFARLGHDGLAPRGWVRSDGRLFLNTSWARNSLSFPLFDESGHPVLSDVEVITGFSQPTNVCSLWTSSTDAAGTSVGDAGGGNDKWVGASLRDCGSAYRLYCMGTDYASPFTIPPPAGSYQRIFHTPRGFAWTPGNGIGDADAACAGLAVSYGLCPAAVSCPFLAVLARPGMAASSRFSNLSLPVYQIDGTRVAASATNLFAGVIDIDPSLSPDGNTNSGEFTWTGGSGSGSVASTCNDWMDGSSSGSGVLTQTFDTQMRPPSTASPSVWNSLGTHACDFGGNLLCME